LDTASLDDLYAYLKPHGYKAVYVNETAIELIEVNIDKKNSQLHELGYGNMILIPDEKNWRSTHKLADKFRNLLASSGNA